MLLRHVSKNNFFHGKDNLFYYFRIVHTYIDVSRNRFKNFVSIFQEIITLSSNVCFWLCYIEILTCCMKFMYSFEYISYHFYGTWFEEFLYLSLRKEYQHSSMSGCNNGAWWWWSSSGSWNESAGDLFAKLRGSYLLHSLAFRLRREWDGDLLQKSKKNWKTKKRERFFFFSFEWSTKKCHQLFQVCDPKTYRQ